MTVCNELFAKKEKYSKLN